MERKPTHHDDDHQGWSKMAPRWRDDGSKMVLEGLLGGFGGPLGRFWGALWGLLGASGGLLGAS